MAGRSRLGSTFNITILSCALLVPCASHAATKTMDLDGNALNGAESQCDLNVLQTFPVMIEAKVTNRAVGDAYTFSWPSAGPGGFTSSVPGGSTGGVGAKWVWTTNQSVFAFTGSTCDKDLCFAQTGGPDAAANFCSLACLADSTTVALAKGATAGTVALSWTGGQPNFTVYRSGSPNGVVAPANAVGTTSVQSLTDTPPAGGIAYYVVRGIDCSTRKACTTDADCPGAGDGTCVSRGPFGVPGRSLYTNDVTVSSASLTSSLITFFSPPKEIFRVTSTVAPGGAYQESLTNTSPLPLTVTVAGYPPGCCEQPHQIYCSGLCFDYLTDPNNCGGCGLACGEGAYCSEGVCTSTCPEGSALCGGTCTDIQNDPNNCGACGFACNTGCEGSGCFPDRICAWGDCVTCLAPEDHACGNVCTDILTDKLNCGACGFSCDDYCANGSPNNFCNDGACICLAGPGWTVPGPIAFAASVVEAPICETPPSVTVIPAGGTSTTCEVQRFLATELPTSVLVCGDGIPDGQARCPNGEPASQGTFMKLVPDPTKPIGIAAVTPYAVHVFDPSNDGLIQPGESVGLNIEVVNAGPVTIADAHAELVSPQVDLTDDGIVNPVAVTIAATPQPYGNILGTPPVDCGASPTVTPATNAAPFQVTFPSGHPGDTSRPFVLKFTGTVNGDPFAMDVPITLGIADACNAASGTGDYDGLAGLSSPMAKLVPLGDPVPFPDRGFTPGSTRPLKLTMTCGGVSLGEGMVEAPEIVGLSEATRGELDIKALNLNSDNGTNPNDPFFRYSPALSPAQWVYNMRTALLGTGTFTLRIRIAGRKVYSTGFVLQ